MDACRMGGDILYDVPKKPLRPTEQGMVYTGHVAHTKERPEEAGKDNAGKDNDESGAADVELEGQSAGPVQPIEPIASPPPSASTVPLVPISPLSHGHVDAGRPIDGGQ